LQLGFVYGSPDFSSGKAVEGAVSKSKEQNMSDMVRILLIHPLCDVFIIFTPV
jgi:hypothetical protein